MCMCVPMRIVCIPMCMCVFLCVCCVPMRMCVCVPTCMCVCVHMCMCVCVHSMWLSEVLAIYPRLALNSWESSCLYLLCATGIPGVLPHTWFNLLCIMNKIDYLVCVNKNIWKDAVWLWTTTITKLLEGVCVESEETDGVGRISILCRGWNLTGPAANYFTLC